MPPLNSVIEIIGPAMVGPSSSHTVGTVDPTVVRDMSFAPTSCRRSVAPSG